jgi:hypothetical protein
MQIDNQILAQYLVNKLIACIGEEEARKEYGWLLDSIMEESNRDNLYFWSKVEALSSQIAKVSGRW